MRKRMFAVVVYTVILSMLCTFVPVVTFATAAYPEITAVQNDEGTFISMNGDIICELEENRFLRFRATNLDDNWVGCERKGADLCIGFADAGVTGIVVESADFTNNSAEGWFEIAVSGYKDGLDCNVTYSVKGIWMPELSKFKYTYTTAMDADLEKWYENSVSAKSYYNSNPNSTAPIEITDYHVEHIAYTDINQSPSYSDEPLRYEWFLSAQDGTTWEKFPKVHVPYPTRSGNYITIRKNGERCYEGAKFGFTDSKKGGWMSTITDTTAGINFELCWYFFDVHMIMYNAVPKRGSAERFNISFAMDFEPISAAEGNELVEGAEERNWRELDEYALPLFSRNNKFDVLISDDSIASEITAEYYPWWASSYDCYPDNTVGYDDNYSVTIKRTGVQTMPAAWNTYTWGEPFEKTDIRNHKYRLSAMIKTENCTGDVRLVYGVQKNNADLFYGTNTHLADGTPREDIIAWQYSDALTGTNDWTPVSMEFTVNNNVNSIILEQNGSGQCWFDNVVIEDLGEVTADNYYIYDDFEKNKVGDWAINANGTIAAKNGALVIGINDDATNVAKATKPVTAHGGRWIAEMDATINTKRGTILAMENVFNLEVSGSTFQAKTGDSTYARVDTNFETSYVTGTPVSFKFVMDFDTKALELWYNGSKVDLGNGNYIRSGSVEALKAFIIQINKGYTGDITIDRFMLYPDTDTGAVNVSREALKLDESQVYKADISLPASGINGAAITWVSSDDTAITDSGKVLRGDAMKYATLTATISKNKATLTKSFSLRVAPYKGLTFTADSLSTGASDTEARVTVANDSAEEYEAPVLFIACFKDDMLIGANYTDVELSEEAQVYTLSASHSGTADRVEIFFWEKDSLCPIAEQLIYEFSAETVLEISNYVQVGEAVSFDVYEQQSGIKTPVDEYTLSCDGMTVDYDAKTVSFASGGIKNVAVTTSKGVANATVIVNDIADKVAVKGSAQFDADFTASDALNTFYTAGAGKYFVTEANGTKVLSTKTTSDYCDTLLFGPALADYMVEMDYVTTDLKGSGYNAISVGMRAKSDNDHSSYRVGVMERGKFGGDTVLYNRLAIGRSKSQDISKWYYSEYTDNAFTYNKNVNYKLVASICGNRITAVLYDANGNMVDTQVSTTTAADFNTDGTAATALASGKTLISYHSMVAQISDIKIYGFDKAGEITLTPSSQTVSEGDSLTLSAYAGDAELDSSMVKYTAASGFDISGDTAVATTAGTHTIVAEYTDYSGKVKYAVATIEVQ